MSYAAFLKFFARIVFMQFEHIEFKANKDILFWSITRQNGLVSGFIHTWPLDTTGSITVSNIYGSR